MQFFRCSKILGEAGKQEILQLNVPKILDLKSSSEQIFSKNCRWVPLTNAYVDQYSVQHAEVNAQFIMTVSLYHYFTLFYVKNRTFKPQTGQTVAVAKSSKLKKGAWSDRPCDFRVITSV